MATSVLSTPTAKSWPSVRAMLRSSVVILLLVAGFLGLGAAYGRHRFGSVAATLAYLGGERLLVDDLSKSVSGVKAGSPVVVRYTLTNLTGHPVTLVGKMASCSCTNIEGLPLTLAMSETRAVSATITLSKDKPDLSGTIRLFTDDLHTPEIALAYSVHALPGSSGVR